MPSATSRTSKVAALANSRSWTIGGTRSTKRLLRSFHSIRNSLTISERMRRHMTLLQAAPRARDRHCQEQRGEAQQGQQIGKEDGPHGAGQEQRLQARDVVAGREYRGHSLQPV